MKIKTLIAAILMLKMGGNKQIVQIIAMVGEVVTVDGVILIFNKILIVDVGSKEIVQVITHTQIKHIQISLLIPWIS